MSMLETDETNLEDKFALWVETCQGIQHPKTKNDELRADAREFFRSGLSVPSSYTDPREGSLAKLIQSLGPALAASWPSRICALNILCGAIEGCQDANLKLKTANLVVGFLLQQCGPMKDDNNDGCSVEDYDEQVRDSAIEGLSALIKCKFALAENQKEIIEAFQLRCKVARQGTESRCAAPEEEDASMDHGFGGTTLNDVRGGLSVLPRSRRSRCFALLQSAIEGMEYIIHSNKNQLTSLGKKIENEAVDFVSFSCNCLQGESDPRCLVQLLTLLNKIQVVFEPLFRQANMASFPITEVFDAVAPYYPINFTPPPHDSHGITQKGLRNVLMAVLTFFGYDELATKKKQETMLSLSLGIVLERLIPMGGDGGNLAESATEKQEAIDDLFPILFPEDDSTFDRLDEGAVQQLSAALILVHQQASVAVSQGGAVTEDKRLADTCRILISKIAYRLEGARNRSLWNIFVNDAVKSMSTKLASASVDGRIAVAFLACLAASGGPQTLRCALDAGLKPLISMLKEHVQDGEMITAAAYGTGAFFSSCRVAIEKASEAGLVLHPHPLESFCSDAFQALYTVFADSTEIRSVALQIATVRALESVLLVSPRNHFDKSSVSNIVDFARTLADCVLEASKSAPAQINNIEFLEASAETLGTILGKCMGVPMEQKSDSPSHNGECILAIEQVQDELRGKIFVDLLFKAKQKSMRKEQIRYDRLVLAKAASTNISAAGCVVECLLHSLKDVLQISGVGTESLECARALSYVLINAGVVAARAFHELAQPNVTPHEIFDRLSDIDPRKGRGKSNLDLPATQEESENVEEMMREIVSLLLPAYEKWVPRKEVFNMVSVVSKVLPPLSNKDVNKLSISLPLLASSFENTEALCKETGPDYTAMVQQLSSIANDLAFYSLNLNYDARSRSAAATCLHAYIVYFANRDIGKCPVEPLLEEVIVPSLLQGLKAAPSDHSVKESVDCLNLAAVLGSGAACRGGKSSAVADRLASFFIELACKRKAAVPFAKNANIEIDLLAFDSDGNLRSFGFAMRSVAAFGSMLGVEDRRPIWKQRLTHNTFKYIDPILKSEDQSGAKPTINSLGLVAIVCHIVCAGAFKNVNLAARGVAVRAVVKNLISGPFYDEKYLKDPGISYEIVAVKKLVIASILKLACSDPGLLSSYIESIVTGLMRAYAVTADSDPLTDITCKLLILQVFERICHLQIGRKTLLALRPAIVSILGAAMNHPSRMLREAAVAVRNIWYTLE